MKLLIGRSGHQPRNSEVLMPQEPGFREDGLYVPNPYFMRAAIYMGRIAPRDNGNDQHPVGAVVTYQFRSPNESLEQRDYEWVAGVGHNGTNDVTIGHAEIAALTYAEKRLGRRGLGEHKAVLYTTHEPCPMCAGAIAASKLVGVVYGTSADDARQLVEEENIQWRNNAVSGLDVIRGREETNSGAPQFIVDNFLQDECYSLLATSPNIEV